MKLYLEDGKVRVVLSRSNYSVIGTLELVPQSSDDAWLLGGIIMHHADCAALLTERLTAARIHADRLNTVYQQAHYLMSAS